MGDFLITHNREGVVTCSILTTWTTGKGNMYSFQQMNKNLVPK